MDNSDNWIRNLSPPRRNHFFSGKMMGVAQFEREQRYDRGQRWLMNRLTVGAGILCGLDIKVTADGKRISVAPGAAVDCFGREIVVARTFEYDPSKTGGGSDCGCGEGPAISQSGDYLLCLSYRECTTDDQPAQYADDCSGQPDCQPDTTVESFAISVRTWVAPSDTTGFDCDKWTLPVVAPSTPSAPPGGYEMGTLALAGSLARRRTPGRQPGITPSPPTPRRASSTPAIGETPGPPLLEPPPPPPATPPPSPPGTAPSIAVLRERLAQQFGTSCGRLQADGCVPLGRITVAKNADATLALSLPLDFKEPRVQIYSQTQLLDMVLCLASQVARCCGKKATSTLRVTKVKPVRRGNGATFTSISETDPPNESWPVYAWPGIGVGEGPSAGFFLQVTFNGPVAPSSLPLISGDMTTPSVSLELTHTRAGVTTTDTIPLVGLLLPPPANNDQLILETRPSGIVTHVPPKLGDLGIYELTLRGSEDAAGNPPFSSIRSSETNEMLDGDENTDPSLPPGRRFPSGDGDHGGDFSFKFEIQVPETLPPETLPDVDEDPVTAATPHETVDPT